MTSSPALLARVEACRADLARQLAAYRDLIAAASKSSGMSLTRIDAALAAFEPGFFNHLLLALDGRFARVATPDDPAVLEVRLLCDALAGNGGVLAVPAEVAYEPSRSVTGLDAGDRIALSAEKSSALSDAFLAALERACRA